jgi:hypothetical protein
MLLFGVPIGTSKYSDQQTIDLAMDGLLTTNWQGTGNVDWVGMSYDNTIRISGFEISNLNNSSVWARLNNFKIQGANDDDVWQDILVVSTTWTVQTKTFLFTSPKNYKKFRIFPTGLSYIYIAEIKPIY